jgi:methylenetetrahydrofolate reductase (NADPH)
LVLQGDAIKNEGRFTPQPDGHKFASDLLQQVVEMNKGVYLDEEIQNPNPSNFCIGVAGYPEKHFASPNLKTDLKFLKQKVDLGAEYIVTQMFFDNKKYFEFVNLCREADITIPIIPGIKPITTKSQASILPTTFHIDLPEALSDEVE